MTCCDLHLKKKNSSGCLGGIVETKGEAGRPARRQQRGRWFGLGCFESQSCGTHCGTGAGEGEDPRVSPGAAWDTEVPSLKTRRLSEVDGGVQLWPLLFQDAIRDPGCQEGSWSDGV